jgi:O-antigen ligase
VPLPPLTPNRSLADAADRRALRTLQLGALLVVLAALPWKVFELDRFFVPKELVLHAVALAATLLALRAGGPGISSGNASPEEGAPADRGGVLADPRLVDLALAAYLVLGLASALAATNPWLAARALALSASGAALFWTGRRLAAVGLDGPLLTTLAAATALAAGTALAQAYGIRSEYFSLNRAPGGTFGNRNFVAHLAAIGTPLLVLALLRARAAGGVVVSAVGLAATTALLVLSRSRGAWLAAGASLLPLAIGVVRASRLPTGERLPTRRLALAAFLPAVGIAAALALPNRLDWRSGSPYLDSMKGVVDYRGGSGRGRLQQYANSARMTADHPLLGVGPGNWAVRYPRRPVAHAGAGHGQPVAVERLGSRRQRAGHPRVLCACCVRRGAALAGTSRCVAILRSRPRPARRDPRGRARRHRRGGPLRRRAPPGGTGVHRLAGARCPLLRQRSSARAMASGATFACVACRCRAFGGSVAGWRAAERGPERGHEPLRGGQPRRDRSRRAARPGELPHPAARRRAGGRGAALCRRARPCRCPGPPLSGGGGTPTPHGHVHPEASPRLRSLASSQRPWCLRRPRAAGPECAAGRGMS